MRRAEPSELNAKVVPVLAATLSKKDVERLFPVRFDDMDPFSEPEPSKGALVQLKSGPFAVVVWGKSTGNLTVSLPEKADTGKVIAALLAEAPVSSKAITWRLDVPAPKRARAATAVSTTSAAKRRSRPQARPGVGAHAMAAKKPARKAAHHLAPRRKR
jgi:hypothetical protein